VTEIIASSLLNGLVYGLLLFMLSSGLTLIFSMMGVLNFAHASLYMLGAYFAYTISSKVGYWPALVLAPILVGLVGAAIERYGLRHVHKYGHVPELIFTFGVAYVLEELVQLIWGKNNVDYSEPKILSFPLFTLFGSNFPAYKAFMLLVSITIFLLLLYVLTKSRVGIIIQAAITHPNQVAMLGHNVPFIFMAVFGVGSALAGLAGAIAGPVLGTFPGMAVVLGSIVFVVIVIGGLGSLKGAFIASLLLGFLQTFAVAVSYRFSDFFSMLGFASPDEGLLADLYRVSVAQMGPLLPYILLVLMLIFRPTGLYGKREM
jgi:branched-chain amino acid transport system permease protein